MLPDSTKLKIEQHIASLPLSLRCENATEEELCNFEEKFGKIPEDYRWFLKTCGGGYFGPAEVDSINQLQKSHAKFRRESGQPRGWTMQNVFIIGWDSSGNPFGIEQATGKILVEDHDFGGIHQIAESLEDFMLKGIAK